MRKRFCPVFWNGQYIMGLAASVLVRYGHSPVFSECFWCDFDSRWRLSAFVFTASSLKTLSILFLSWQFDPYIETFIFFNIVFSEPDQEFVLRNCIAVFLVWF